MRDRLTTRLEELRAEYEIGKTTLEDLESQVASVRATMLRISGAIQVLEEELATAAEATAPEEGDLPAEVPNGQAGPALGTPR